MKRYFFLFSCIIFLSGFRNFDNQKPDLSLIINHQDADQEVSAENKEKIRELGKYLEKHSDQYKGIVIKTYTNEYFKNDGRSVSLSIAVIFVLEGLDKSKMNTLGDNAVSKLPNKSYSVISLFGVQNKKELSALIKKISKKKALLKK